jgi:copper transport protein
VAGAFSFSVGAPSAVVSTAPRGVNVVVGGLDAVSRAVSFGGLALAIGGACLLLVLWPEGPRSRSGRRLLWTGIGALLGGTLLLLPAAAPVRRGGLRGRHAPPLAAVLQPGDALRARAGRAAAAGRGVRGPGGGGPARDARPPGALGLGACAVGLVFTSTLSDHSRTGAQTWLGVPAASVHLLAMALWLGGLTLLLFAVLRPPARR